MTSCVHSNMFDCPNHLRHPNIIRIPRISSEYRPNAVRTPSLNTVRTSSKYYPNIIQIPNATRIRPKTSLPADIRECSQWMATFSCGPNCYISRPLLDNGRTENAAILAGRQSDGRPGMCVNANSDVPLLGCVQFLVSTTQ